MSNLNFKDEKVLIVGGAGFVGSNLAHRILKDNPKHLCIVDNLLSADISNVPIAPNAQFIFGSISDDRILQQLPVDFDYIFHLSTYHGNQSSIADPIADHEHNTLTTLKLCEHFKNSKALKKVVYAAAGCTVAKKTFDATEATDEEASISLYLDSPYQISKMIGEFYGNYYFLRYQLPFVKARFQNVYGPREILGAGSWRGTPATVWRNVTPTFIWRALHNQTLPLEKGGVATRDFIYADDIVDGLMACALKGVAGGVYNLASGEETSIKQLADLICEYTGTKAAPVTAATREWDRSGRRFGNTEKATKEIGFTAKVNLETGLKRTIAWTRENYSTILQCVLKHQYFLPEVKQYLEEPVEA